MSDEAAGAGNTLCISKQFWPERLSCFYGIVVFTRVSSIPLCFRLRPPGNDSLSTAGSFLECPRSSFHISGFLFDARYKDTRPASFYVRQSHNIGSIDYFHFFDLLQSFEPMQLLLPCWLPCVLISFDLATVSGARKELISVCSSDLLAPIPLRPLSAPSV